MSERLIRESLAAADSREVPAFLRYLSEEAAFRFGNAPVIRGHAAIAQALTAFFEHVVQMRHTVEGVHQCGEVWAVEMTAAYMDRFGRAFAFPACNLLRIRRDQICDYRIFVDNSAMFIPPG